MSIQAYVMTYNCIEYGYCILETVKSVLPVVDEIIVVDGGSTDDTLNVLDGIQRVRIIERPWDFGSWDFIMKQMTFTRQCCDADYVIELAADLVLHEGSYDFVRGLPKTHGDLFVKSLLLEIYTLDRVVNFENRMFFSPNLPEVGHGPRISNRVTHPDGSVTVFSTDAFDYIHVDTSEWLEELWAERFVFCPEIHTYHYKFLDPEKKKYCWLNSPFTIAYNAMHGVSHEGVEQEHARGIGEFINTLPEKSQSIGEFLAEYNQPPEDPPQIMQEAYGG